MKILNMLLIGVLTSCLSTPGYSDGLSCIGMDGTGQTIHLLLDVDTATVNINGNILKINGGSKDGEDIWTRNYISDEGVLAKGVLTHKKRGSDDLIFLQVNAVNNNLIAQVPLACKRI